MLQIVTSVVTMSYFVELIRCRKKFNQICSIKVKETKENSWFLRDVFTMAQSRQVQIYHGYCGSKKQSRKEFLFVKKTRHVHVIIKTVSMSESNWIMVIFAVYYFLLQLLFSQSGSHTYFFPLTWNNPFFRVSVTIKFSISKLFIF